ncbi:BTAD domain-containing putative transcriptional regulator [Streptomyces achromogenes]|uniref:AfsR/SARP family transcriptional regulator n=1 Tax=Streptomyces achromogenes TaxID=67255 RepID=UPI0037CF2E46
MLFERERLRQLRLHALDALAHRLPQEGKHALALEAALTSVRSEPLRESGHRAVVAAQLAAGDVDEAVRHYDAFRRLLREELGVPPSPLFMRMLPAAPSRWPGGRHGDDGEMTHAAYLRESERTCLPAVAGRPTPLNPSSATSRPAQQVIL